jgi:LEA14-like dessication related protein
MQKGRREMVGRARAVILVAVVTCTGCGLAFQEPTFAVAEVRLASLGLGGGTLTVALDIDNPNRYALESEDFQYRLDFLDDLTSEEPWLTLAEGRVDESVRIPARESGSVRVDIPFEFGAVGMALGGLLRRGELEYRFTGELRVRTPLGASRVPFDERGVFRP